MLPRQKMTDEDYYMTEKQSSQKIKAYIRELYAKLAAHGTANISSLSIEGGEELARALDTTPQFYQFLRKRGDYLPAAATLLKRSGSGRTG